MMDTTCLLYTSWNASSDAISVQEGYSGTDVVVTGVKAGTAVLTASTAVSYTHLDSKRRR